MSRRSRDHAPRGVLAAFAVTVLCAAGFATAYTLDLGPEAMGATLGGAFAFVALGLAIWSQKIDEQEPDYVEERALGPAPREEHAAFREALTTQPVPRSGVLWTMLGVALASIGGAALFPLRSLFPKADASPRPILSATAFTPGARLVTEDGVPVRPDDLSTHSVITVFPENVDIRHNVDTTTLLIRVDASELKLPDDRLAWVVDGVVAYSKLCTHAGCPVGLYADSYRQLFCPCHHSIFDVLHGAVPIEGPAAHALPQLPLGLDDDGYLVARGDFPSPVGPGWWGYDA